MSKPASRPERWPRCLAVCALAMKSRHAGPTSFALALRCGRERPNLQHPRPLTQTRSEALEDRDIFNT